MKFTALSKLQRTGRISKEHKRQEIEPQQVKQEEANINYKYKEWSKHLYFVFSIWVLDTELCIIIY